MGAKDIFQYGLGALVVFGFFYVLNLLFGTEPPPANNELLFTMLGMLSMKFGDIIAYFFNSTKGSAEKTAMIHNSIATKPADEDTIQKTQVTSTQTN